MSVTVYVWDQDAKNSYAHMALSVGNIYISWWPKKREKSALGGMLGVAKLGRQVEHSTNVCFVKEYEEAGEVDLRVSIEDGVLKEEAMLKWWTNYSVNNIEHRTVKKHDATTIHKALFEGGAPKYRNAENQVYDIIAYLNIMKKVYGDWKMHFTYFQPRTPWQEERCTSHDIVTLQRDSEEDDIFFGT
jgi:hypothetical protein